MPLHDWTDLPGWDGMHQLWIVEMLRWVKPRLPAGYRAYIGSASLLAVGAPTGRPEMHVHHWPPSPDADRVGVQGASSASPDDTVEPDLEIAVATLDPGTTLFVEQQGRLVAAVELVSPRNKDRPASREAYLARYLGYLLDSVHLVLVDVHRRPVGFSFADRIGAELSLAQEPMATPLAISYRVGEPAPNGGRFLAIWRRPLSTGASLPALPLPLAIDYQVEVDLERTYSAAAVDAYLE
jgi:hypothetical protein